MAGAKASPRTRELLSRFSRRLDLTTFTAEGLPSPEEVNLTKDVWASLTGYEQRRICDNARKELSGGRGGPGGGLPDVTPYAMRLTLKYLKVMRQSC